MYLILLISIVGFRADHSKPIIGTLSKPAASLALFLPPTTARQYCLDTQADLKYNKYHAY